MKTATIILAVLGLCNASTYILEKNSARVHYSSQSLYVNRNDLRNLDDLLKQFADMIPFDKIQAIADDYRANDPDVKQAYEFLMSDEFKGLVDQIKALPEFQEFKQYLIDSGLDYDYWLDIVRKLLGFPTTPVRKHFIRAESGIIRMIKDILAILPIDDIKNWFYNVCLPDPDFQAFLERIRSPDFLKLVDFIYNSPEYKHMTDIMLEQGIDVAAIEKVISDFLNGTKIGPQSLNDLLKQFAAMIPFDKIQAIADDYRANDPDVKQAYEFLMSDEFKGLVDQIKALPEFQEFKQYLIDSGLDYDYWLDIIKKLLGFPTTPVRKHFIRAESGIIRMIKDILAILPIDDIKNWFYNVCLPDPDFQAFLERIRSPDFLKLVDFIYNSPEYKHMTDIMLEQGIDVAAIEKVISDFLNGTKIRPQSLNDLLKQFAAMIPFDKIQAIADDYRANDPDVKQAYEFLMSDEFKGLVDQIKALPEFQEFKQYLIDSGLDYDYWLDIIKKLLGFPTTPVRKHFIRAESGIIRMIKDILAILPIEDIKNWFYNVCLPDPDFQAFLERIRSPDFLKLVDFIYNSPEYKHMTDIMLEQGIDVAAIEKVISDFLNGTKIGPQSLNDLLKQFAAMIPFDKIQAIADDYRANDPDVKQAFDFLMSDEFKGLVDKIKAMPEFQEFKQYLIDSGLDYDYWLDIVRKLLGFPTTPVRKHFIRAESGIIRMIKDILAILPIDDIKNWFYNVCLPDPDFQAFLERIRSPDFLKLVDFIYNSPEYKHMTDIMLEQGIDVAAIEKVISDFLNGTKIRPQSLNDLLKQFADMIPFDKIQAIADDYRANDPDVKQAYEFLMSDEFKGLVDQIKALPEFQEFKQYLIDSGLDYDYWLDIIKKLLGFPTTPVRKHFIRAESGIIRMIKDILAILPIEDIKNWFYNVCLPDPDFQAFLERIRSPDFLKLVDFIYNSPEYKHMTDIMLEQGIDVAAIEKVISDFLNGTKIGPQSLNDLLKQFAAMIPFDKIQAIADDYRANDPDVKQAFDFLMSDEFKGLVDKIKAMPEFQEFKQYLIDSGLDYDYWLDIVRKLLGFPTTPVRKHFIRAESGIIRMINDILAVLPIDDIKNWFYNVCLPDPDFQAFLERIRSPDFLKLVDLVYNSPEYKDMTDIMLQQGIDVAAIEKAIGDFLNAH